MRDLTQKTYSGIFDARGSLYDAAMRRWPQARGREFGALLDLAQIKPGDAVCDFPAGGGYIADYLPAGAQLTLAEKSEAFHALIRPGVAKTVLARGNALPVAAGTFDKVVSLAGIHHEEDQPGFFRECARVLKTGGAFVLGDVIKDSPQARFLDTFIDAHNKDGHSGIYFDDTTADAVAASGLAVVSAGPVSYPWIFSSEEEMGAFCGGLFGVEGLAPAAAVAGIRDFLTVRHENDKVLLDWQLDRKSVV